MHSALYEGKVRHRRLAPVPHEFDYAMFMVYLDLAEVDTAFSGRWLWSASRRAIARYRREDHLGDPAIPLDQCVRDLVLKKTGRSPEGPIRLLTHLAYYGWCFNPVSFYYCFDRAGVLEAVVAEVSNTPWLERHFYVLDRKASLTPGEALSWRAPKLLHVSPFMKMEQEYIWALRAPNARLTVHMENLEHGQKLFDATMTVSRVEITGCSLASALLRWPFMTLFVVGGIHWQAFKLWFKGVPVIDHPKKRAAKVTTMTISERQFEFVKARIEREGLSDKVEVVLRDYRKAEGSYDSIVSIEMIEAVGHEFLGTFFATCDRLLKPHGVVVIQGITIPDQRYDAYRGGCDWIQKHIFPGALLPSLTAMCSALTANTSLMVESVENIGAHYAPTLRLWREALLANKEKVKVLGFDDVFLRTWDYYFSYCEAGFSTRTLGDLQLVLTRPNNRRLPVPEAK